MSPLCFRHYFVSSPFLAVNPGEQFFLFSVIAAWLINEAGRPFTAPQEHDEPNATVSNILSELRALVSRAAQLPVVTVPTERERFQSKVTSICLKHVFICSGHMKRPLQQNHFLCCHYL